MTPSLDTLRRLGEISPLDHAFATSLGRLAGETRPEVLVAAGLVSRQSERGDVCLDLERIAAEAVPPEDRGWPRLEEWIAELVSSELVASPASGDDGELRPLVLDRQRLYLRRAFEDERRVAASFAARAAAPVAPFEPSRVRASIDRLLPRSAPGGETDWPRVAAGVAVAGRLCLIAGGPGTGKTTTAARLLAVLVESELASGRPRPRIALAAPTGKAAARLAEAIAGIRSGLDCDASVRDAVPTSASTLHRLLGLGRGPRGTGAPRRIGAHVVLVDEASMIDLALMAKLCAALSDSARLILLGDADQLASVEAGAVFADLCGPRVPAFGEERSRLLVAVSGEQGERVSAPRPGAGAALADCVVTLQRSHRYEADSGIGALAQAVRAGDAARALEVLEDDRFGDVSRVEPAAGRPFGAELQEAVLRGYAPALGPDAPRSIAERLSGLARFRLLCALREGPFGVADLNRRADAALVSAGVLEPSAPGSATVVPAGRPIGITRNAPQVGLFNGDVGLLERSGTPGSRRSAIEGCFERDGGVARFGVSRLPAYEPVLATTVHKSQGSEFDEVAFVMPEEALPLVTRELVYTAVTRARRRVVVHARESVLRTAIGTRISRASGLRDALWP